MKNKNNFGITLMELLVVITIIGIIALGVSNMNFNVLNDRQKIEIFKNDIISNFENIRSNAITGKGIGINLETPKKWRIEFSNNGSGSIKSYYSLDGNLWKDFDELTFEKYYEIKKLSCININNTLSNDVLSGSGIIEFNGTNITLTGACNNPEYKKLKTTIKYKNNFEETIEINTINGLIENL